MSASDGHPPTDQRCQIYIEVGTKPDTQLLRCVNLGSQWVKWGGCDCDDKDWDVCEDGFESWECGGPHSPVELGAA